MKTVHIHVNFSGDITVPEKVIGHQGEHNATVLQIALSPEYLTRSKYFRLHFKSRGLTVKSGLITPTGKVYTAPTPASDPRDEQIKDLSQKLSAAVARADTAEKDALALRVKIDAALEKLR